MNPIKKDITIYYEDAVHHCKDVVGYHTDTSFFTVVYGGGKSSLFNCAMIREVNIESTGTRGVVDD